MLEVVLVLQSQVLMLEDFLFPFFLGKLGLAFKPYNLYNMFVVESSK